MPNHNVSCNQESEATQIHATGRPLEIARHEEKAETEQELDLLSKIEQFEDHLTEVILSRLDARSLYNASRVCKSWRRIIRRGRIWKRLIEKNVASDPDWAYLVKSESSVSMDSDNTSYEKIYSKVAGIRRLDNRWENCEFTLSEIVLGHSRCASLAAHNEDEVIIESSKQIRIFSSDMKVLKKTFKLPEWNSDDPLCMQFNDQMVICSSSDKNIYIWRRNDPDDSGPCNTLSGHIHGGTPRLKFNDKMMVSCSRHGYIHINDRCQSQLIIWEIISPCDVRMQKSLEFPGESIGIDFDDNFIVCGLREVIKLWDAKTYDFLKDISTPFLRSFLLGDSFIATAQFTRAVMIWDVKSGNCIRSMYADYPNSVWMSTNRLLCSEYGRSQLRYWNLRTVLDKSVPDEDVRCTKLDLPDCFMIDINEIRLNYSRIVCKTCDAEYNHGIYILDFRDQKREERSAERKRD